MLKRRPAAHQKTLLGVITLNLILVQTQASRNIMAGVAQPSLPLSPGLQAPGEKLTAVVADKQGFLIRLAVFFPSQNRHEFSIEASVRIRQDFVEGAVGIKSPQFVPVALELLIVSSCHQRQIGVGLETVLQMGLLVVPGKSRILRGSVAAIGGPGKVFIRETKVGLVGGFIGNIDGQIQLRDRCSDAP